MHFVIVCNILQAEIANKHLLHVKYRTLNEYHMPPSVISKINSNSYQLQSPIK